MGQLKRHWRHAPYHQTISKATTQSLRDSIVPCKEGSRPLNPKTLKMSAYGTLSPTATPKGLANTVGAAPPRVRHVAGGAGKTSCTLTTTKRWVASTCKGQAASGCFASLDRFPAPSASVSFATPTEMERGQKERRSRAFYP